MAAAFRLHEHAPGSVNGQTYLQWGERTWEWIQSHHLINKEGLVENGLNDKCELETGALYTYNQGVMMGALLSYYRVTNEREHLLLATRIADATIERLIDEEGILRENKRAGINGGLGAI